MLFCVYSHLWLTPKVLPLRKAQKILAFHSFIRTFARRMTDLEVIASRDKHGANVLTPPPETPLWRLYLEKYQDPIIRILLVAACVSLVLAFVEHDFVETIGIIIAIFLATTIGFVFERDAAKKFRILNRLDEEKAV